MPFDPESVIGMRVRLLPAAIVRLVLNPNVKDWTGTIKAERISEKGNPAKFTIHLDEHIKEPEDVDVEEQELERA